MQTRDQHRTKPLAARQKNALIAADKSFVWHPFTQMAEWAKDDPVAPLVIASGKGNYLHDIDGKKYIDGVSSLWVTLHGHRKKEIDAAVRRQLGKIAHSTFLGLTHEPAIRLAQELIALAPGKLRRVFYSDSGSTSVEMRTSSPSRSRSATHSRRLRGPLTVPSLRRARTRPSRPAGVLSLPRLHDRTPGL